MKKLKITFALIFANCLFMTSNVLAEGNGVVGAPDTITKVVEEIINYHYNWGNYLIIIAVIVLMIAYLAKKLPLYLSLFLNAIFLLLEIESFGNMVVVGSWAASYAPTAYELNLKYGQMNIVFGIAILVISIIEIAIAIIRKRKALN